MSPPREERGPRKGLVHDLEQRSPESITRGTDPHAALMANLDWHLQWLSCHRHWWLRELEWRERGRVA